MSEVSEETPAIEVHGLCNRFGAHVVHEGLDLVVRAVRKSL